MKKILKKKHKVRSFTITYDEPSKYSYTGKTKSKEVGNVSYLGVFY